jgi:hypothetical protein
MRGMTLLLALTISVAAQADQVQPSGPPADIGAHARDVALPTGPSSSLFEFAQARRPWRCTSVNSRGQVFTGRASTREQARRTAMNRCTAWSNSCRLRGCS